ncbi:hypothetical protein, partial [Escherichia coli]|uniref:hypothetical protein n=1 Tax=Escherichia coli TaxID=562 RepID=UPI00293BD085
MSDKHVVPQHKKVEHENFVEIIPEHIDRKESNQTEFEHAKEFLKKVFGGKRCIVCEMRNETPIGNIESHHVFEWCHANDNDMSMVETVLRALSPFIHGLYMVTKD